MINDCLFKKMELDTVAYNTFIKAMLDAGLVCFLLFIYFFCLLNKRDDIFLTVQVD